MRANSIDPYLISIRLGAIKQGAVTGESIMLELIFELAKGSAMGGDERSHWVASHPAIGKVASIRYDTNWLVGGPASP
jgi:hypothetical protein